MTKANVLIDGHWQTATGSDYFQAHNPSTGELLESQYPVSDWADCDKALDAATSAFRKLSTISRETIAKFLESYADKIESHASQLVEMANLETGLPVSPRLTDVEIPRTVSQLKTAATAVREASWTQPTIDVKSNIRSALQAIGPVVVFGPNNFPFAFGSMSGGDFAAAIAAGNPVIAKAHPSHPGTTKLFAELAQVCAEETGLPAGTVQLIYAMSNDDGLKLVSDPRIAATGFTGSRGAGLALKKAADDAGKLIYLELSSVNPVVVLEGAQQERADNIATEFSQSCLMAAGQLCTKPGLLILHESVETDSLIKSIAEQFKTGPVGTLLSSQSADHLFEASSDLVAAGAELLTENSQLEGGRFCHSNTLLAIKGESFLSESDTFQKEMFGNASLIIRSKDAAQTIQIIRKLEGNLTGCIYSDTEGKDDDDYSAIAPELAQKVGRLINDKMPTGVAVSSAMNHGGPFPSSGHPGFTAVGLPASIKRFAALKCFDNVRQHRLPEILADKSPGANIWRMIDGQWTTADVVGEND